MGKAEDSWPCLKQSAWQLINLNCMGPVLEARQEEYLPACMNSGTPLLSANMAPSRFAEPNIPSLRTEQTNEAHGLLHFIPPHFQNLLPTAAPYFREKQSVFSHGLCGKAVLNALPGSSQKKLLIFDQCGTQTQLIYSSVCPPTTYPTTAPTKVMSHQGLHEDEQAAKVGQTDRTKSILRDRSDENCECGDQSVIHEDTEEINALLYSDDGDSYSNEDQSYERGDESEMHEDTDEINALLYSDDHGDYDSYSDEDDEVRSTGHSPMVYALSLDEQHEFEETAEDVSSFSFPDKRQMLLNMATTGSSDKHGQCEEITEEVSGSNGPNKRQKLLNGGHRISLMDTASSVKLDGSWYLDNQAETSYAVSKTRADEIGSISVDKQARKESIRETLRVLESIVPGTKGKDPLLVLNDAIDYLKSLKLKTKTLGVNSLTR